MEIVDKSSTSKLWKEIDHLVFHSIRTCLAQSEVQNENDKIVLENVDCFQLFGFDILIEDSRNNGNGLNAKLLEVNSSPDLSPTDINSDFKMKSKLIVDLLDIVLNPIQPAPSNRFKLMKE